MAKLDEMLAAALRDLAAEGPALPPLSPRARRRIRARRSAAIAASVMVVAAMSAGVVIGAHALARPAHPQVSPHHLATAYVPTAYVLGGSGTVTPIRIATNTALRPIRLGKRRSPCAIAITPDGKTAYVITRGSVARCPHTVTPIRTATNTALRPIKVRQIPAAIAITPDGKTAYTVNFAGRRGVTVTPIRTATNTVLAPVTVGPTFPQQLPAIAITPDGSTAYVNTNAPGLTHQDAVTPIRTATSTALPPITVGRGSCAIAITPDGKTAYVTNMTSGTVTPIRTATNTAQRPIEVGRGPCAMAITR